MYYFEVRVATRSNNYMVATGKSRFLWLCNLKACFTSIYFNMFSKFHEIRRGNAVVYYEIFEE